MQEDITCQVLLVSVSVLGSVVAKKAIQTRSKITLRVVEIFDKL